MSADFESNLWYIPEEMDAKRETSGCRLRATGSYGDESSISPPEITKMITFHYTAELRSSCLKKIKETSDKE